MAIRRLKKPFMEVAGISSIALLATSILSALLLQSPRGDEIDVYLPVVHASTNVWPDFNLFEVAYGISPLWTWAVGGLAALGLSELLAGRLLAFLGWAGCIFLCRREDAPLDLRLAALLAHPVLVVYAARAHPLWPGMFFLLLATRGALYLPLRVALCWAAVTVQNFLLAAVGTLGLLTGKGHLERMRWAFIMSLAGLLGILFNWALYGGQYPAAFVASKYYEPYRNFSGFTIGYLPLTLGLGGWLALILARGRAHWSMSIAAGIGSALVLVSVAHAVPLGPIFNHAAIFGDWAISLVAIMVGLGFAGWMLLDRPRWQIVLGILLGAVSISTLPFYYERYAWFISAPILAVWATQKTIDEAPRAVLSAWLILSLGLSNLFLWKGSL
jgi:hypothetical protein